MTLSLNDGDDAQDLATALVTDNYFTTLGVVAAIGRTIRPTGDGSTGANPVVVLSDAVWGTRFGADRSVLDRQIRLSGRTMTVIGVAPKRFRGTNLDAIPDAWVPLSMAPSLDLEMLSKFGVLNPNLPGGPKLSGIVGRLAPSVAIRQASASLNAIARAASSSAPAVTVLPIMHAAAAVRDRSTLVRFIRLLFGVVALTLLLACVNVANLLVVRAGERAPELGVRTAMGASAFRLAQQLFAESALLAIAGGALGLVVAQITVRLFSALTLPGGLALDHLALGLDARVLAFTGALSVVTAIGFGLAPAMQATRTDVVNVLKQQSTGRPRLVGRGALLAAQVAMSLMLLVGAGLFLRSLYRGLSTDLGFDPHPLAAVAIAPQLTGVRADHVRDYLAVVARAKQMPGILAAAASSHVPLAPVRALPYNDGPATKSASPSRKTMTLSLASVTDGYFDVLGVPLVIGRQFGVEDGAGAPRAVILNESAAHAFWPNESALGKQINFLDAETYTVVGVVRDIKYTTLQDRGVPFAYAPMAQEDTRGVVSFVVRATSPRAALSMLRASIAAVSPEMKVVRPRLVTDQVNVVLMPQRFGATLLSVFALVALCISGIGVYGTVAYAVSQRTTEIGIRTALGAQRFDVLRLVLTESGAAILAGVVAGIGGATLTTGFIAHVLYGVSGSDWASFSGAVAAVVAVAVGAVLVPAGRALRVDPARAIRTSQ